MNRPINILHKGVIARLGLVPVPGDACRRIR